MTVPVILFIAPGWVLDYALLGALLAGIAALAVVLGWRGRRTTRGKLLLNVGAVFAACTALELHSLRWAQGLPAHRPENYGAPYFFLDEDLGYFARPNTQSDAALWAGDTMVYETTYRFDGRGCRRIPDLGGPAPEASVLCFGGSYMMGEGLGEEATVPAQLNALLRAAGHGEIRPIPLAFHGWGAHQMLGMIQSGKLADMDLPKPAAAVYWAITDHVSRTSGLRAWDQVGPLFEVAGPGEAVRKGSIADLPGHPIVDRKNVGWATISWAIRRWTRTTPRTGPGEMRRWAAVVATSRRELLELYPGIEFHVIVDDADYAVADQMILSLAGLGIESARMSAILDGYGSNKAPWTFLPHDHHPNEAAAAVIAEFLASRVVAAVEEPGTAR